MHLSVFVRDLMYKSALFSYMLTFSSVSSDLIMNKELFMSPVHFQKIGSCI